MQWLICMGFMAVGGLSGKALFVLSDGVDEDAWLGAGTGIALLVSLTLLIGGWWPFSLIHDDSEASTSQPLGSGTVVRCEDGTYSGSGGIQGACSYHGGESGGWGPSSGWDDQSEGGW